MVKKERIGGPQRRQRVSVDLLRALERATRAVVDGEHALARLVERQAAIRTQLRAAVGVRSRRAIHERVLHVARLVNDAPAPLTRVEIATACDISPGNASNRLAVAVRHGLVARVGDGTYRAVGRGRGDGNLLRVAAR